MRILKLPAKILYYVLDEFNKIYKNVFLYISIQVAARISTGKSDMAITHSWICKIICCVCVLESPHRGDFNTHPKHIILWRMYAD